MPAGTLDGGHELYRARVPLIRRRPLWRGLPSATRGPALAPCIRRRRRSPVHQFPYVGPNRMGKRASPTDPTGISRGHALFWGYPVKSILPLTRTGNLPRANEQSTGLFVARCGAPPCSIPRTETKKSPPA